MGENKATVDDLERAMGFILAAAADGHIGVEQARRLIRDKGVIPAAKQIRKATRHGRRHEPSAGAAAKQPAAKGPIQGKKKRK